jgi:L-lactate dehydrogenase complex protein LldG
MKSVREEILNKLKAARKKAAPPLPDLPVLDEISLKGEDLVAKFSGELSAQAGVVHRVRDTTQALSELTAILRSGGVGTVMASNDDVVAGLDLPAWGSENNIRVLRSRDYDERRRFINAVFTEAEAGITGVDFAVAESGTIGLIPNKDKPRLLSLAPIHHVAILPLDRLVPVYENVTGFLFDKWENAPSHITFITGPSMTADIRSTLFRGMHGPRRLDVILVG